MQNPSDIPVNTDRLPRNPLRADGLPIIDTGIHRLRIIRRHLPERILDEPRGIMFFARHVDLQFQAIGIQKEVHDSYHNNSFLIPP